MPTREALATRFHTMKHKCSMWPWDTPLHWLPIMLVITLITTFFLTYGISVALGHVDAGFPYISDTGTYSPESCIFGQLLNICAVLIGILVYIRSKQVKEFSTTHGTPRMRTVNKVSIILGYLSALGVSMVGNFQETNVVYVHLIGAMLAFGMGLIYSWMQTYLSYKTVPHLCSAAVCHLRAVACTMGTLFLLLTMIFARLATVKYNGTVKTKWSENDGGFVAHVLSTSSEWMMSLCIMAFFVSFVKEFKNIRIDKLCIKVDFCTAVPGSDVMTRLGDDTPQVT